MGRVKIIWGEGGGVIFVTTLSLFHLLRKNQHQEKSGPRSQHDSPKPMRI